MTDTVNVALSACPSVKLRRRLYEFLMDCSGLLDGRLVMVIEGMRR